MLGLKYDYSFGKSGGGDGDMEMGLGRIRVVYREIDASVCSRHCFDLHSSGDEGLFIVLGPYLGETTERPPRYLSSIMYFTPSFASFLTLVSL